MSKTNYIYIIHTREFISLNLPVYKIGKTKQELTSSGRNKRCTGYPKGSIQIAIFAVNDCDKAEKHLIKNLNLSHDITNCKQYGAEYFHGTLENIFKTILSTALLYAINPINDIDNSQPLNNPLQCKYCLNIFSSKTNYNKHVKKCKYKDDYIRNLELQLNISYDKPKSNNTCRFCNKVFSQVCYCTVHIKTCKAKQIYREKLEAQLEAKLKANDKQPQQTINNTTNNIGTVNVLNVSAETLRKFGEESTDHITNAYLRKVIGRLGVPLPKVVSTVAKQIYCDNNNKENQTIQITNVRSQWAKVSNGKDYELQPLGDSVKGVRDKVTDLYVERQCDEPEYFMKVNSRIDKLDDLNNQNYTARTLEDKEDQKNASKLKSQIDREIKSTLYNLQKSGNLCIKF